MKTLFLDLGLLLQRILFAGSMAVFHGFGKVERIGTGEMNMLPGIPGTVEFALAAIAEGVLTILIVFGVATRVVVVPVLFAMCVAAFVAHGSDPLPAESTRIAVEALPADAHDAFGVSNDSETVRVRSGSGELALIYAFGFLSILLMGGGRFALDTIINPVMRRWHKSRNAAKKKAAANKPKPSATS